MATKEKHVEAANKFLKKRNLSRAISEYQKALKLDSDDIRLRLRLGDLLLRDKRPEDAVDVLVKVANIYEDRGFLLKAVSVYKRILQMQPDEAKNRLQLASAQFLDGLLLLTEQLLFVRWALYAAQDSQRQRTLVAVHAAQQVRQHRRLGLLVVLQQLRFGHAVAQRHDLRLQSVEPDAPVPIRSKDQRLAVLQEQR